MKALLLAAGYGTRLRPLTDTVPKVLVPIGGKPLLEYHLASFRKYGIADVLINTHYLPEHVRAFVESKKTNSTMPNVFLTYEPKLLGSAGTLKANQKFFNDEEDFLVVYGDNLASIDYGELFDFHRRMGGICTIASYFEEYPASKGVVVLDTEKQIRKFVEKPAEFQGGSFANAGIYVLNRKIFSHLDEWEEVFDFGTHVFPALLRNGVPMYAYEMKEYFLDIGTPESYNKAQSDILNLDFYDNSKNSTAN